MNNTTLKKISEALGISISTVSRALKDHPDISDKTKQRVTELANVLDYEPNASAVQLRTNKSKLFGLIVPSVANFFYDSFIASVEEESRKKGYSLMILQSGEDVQAEAENLKLCRQNRVSGVFACITSQTISLAPFEKLKDHDIPVVFFDKVPESNQYNKVCAGDITSATIAANTLINKNKRKILALFGNLQLSITKKRLDAFLKTINGKAETIIHHVLSSQEAESVTIKALAQKPDCVFCMSDEILAGAHKAIERSALSIPADISIISISNGYIPKLYFPEITYVETSGYKLGKLAFSTLMTCLEEEQPAQELTIESVLVEGGSI